MTRPDGEPMRHWFKPRRFGYGATPATLAGGLAILGFVALVIAILRLVRSNRIRLGLVLPLLIGFLMLVARKTDGAWRWRN